MRIRTIRTGIAAAVLAAALTGCSLLPGGRQVPSEPPESGPGAPSFTPAPSISIAPTATAPPTPSVVVAIPDPCTLLSTDEVRALTGRGVGQVDHDGGSATSGVRYCQWQQPNGNLGISVWRDTAANFEFEKRRGSAVTGLGDDGFWVDGTLHIRTGPLRFTVQPRGGSDEQNLAETRRVATVLLPRVAALT